MAKSKKIKSKTTSSWRSFNRQTLNRAFKEAESRGTRNTKKQNIGLPTPDYLANLYNAYREQIRSQYSVGFYKNGTNEDQKALMLEKFLNALKTYSVQGNLDNLKNYKKYGDINEILSKQVLTNIIEQLKAINPHLFQAINYQFVSDKNKTEQGTVWEATVAEAMSTVEALLAGKDNEWWKSNGQIQVDMRHTGGLRDNTIDIVSPLTKMSTDLGFKLYHQSAHNQSINNSKKERYFAKESGDAGRTASANEEVQKQIGGNITLSAIQQKQIKIDATGGWTLNDDYTATATVPQELIDAIGDATFTAKSYKDGRYIELGGTAAYKVFMSVADGGYSEKLYRYCRMINCLHHHDGFHDDSKNYIYRIRALYELTGANQRLGQNDKIVNQVVKDLIENPTGAKYLVINNPNPNVLGEIRVISTARIADVIDNYIFFNRQYNTFGDFIENMPYNLTANQALDTKIKLFMDYRKIYNEISNS